MKKVVFVVVVSLVSGLAIFAAVVKRYGGSAEGTATVYAAHGDKRVMRTFSVSTTIRCYESDEPSAKASLKSSLESEARKPSNYRPGLEEIRVSNISYDIDTCEK